MKSLIALLALASTASLPAPAPVPALPTDPVWFWFATCGGPMMTLEVLMDGQVVHRTTFPLCRADRESKESQGQASRVEFTWRPNRVIVWRRDAADVNRSPADRPLEVNVWQAGADPGQMLLGVSVVGADEILMNTLHIAHPAGRDETHLANGVVVRTYRSTRDGTPLPRSD